MTGLFSANPCTSYTRSALFVCMSRSEPSNALSSPSSMVTLVCVPFIWLVTRETAEQTPAPFRFVHIAHLPMFHLPYPVSRGLGLVFPGMHPHLAIKLPAAPVMSALLMPNALRLETSDPSFSQPTPISSSKACRPSPLTRRPAHVPRPRNPFIIFRCDFVKRGVVPASVERDHRIVSRIAGERWHRMSDQEKQTWKDLAEQEKLHHALKYPDYRYRPASRTHGEGRRRPKRHSDADSPKSVRCKEIARLIAEGAEGDLLYNIVDGPAPATLIPRRRSSSCPPAPSISQHSFQVDYSFSTPNTPDIDFLTHSDEYFSREWSMNPSVQEVSPLI